MNINRHLPKLKEICQEDGIKMLGVFGSVARGEDNSESDIDLMIKLKKPIGMFDFIALEDKFVDLFGQKVDLLRKIHCIHKYDKRLLKVLYKAKDYLRKYVQKTHIYHGKK